MSLLTSTPGRTLHLSGPCDLHSVRTAAKAIRNFLEQQGVAADDLDAWELVTAEAGNNAVEYAGTEGGLHPVEFGIEVGPTHVELRVHDHTPGFEIPAAIDLPDPLSEHGRGLFLMRSLSDHLRYLRSPDGNCLVIRRRRAATTGSPPDAQGSVNEAALEATLQAMTEELAACYESLSAIFRFSTEFNRNAISPASVDRWLRELVAILEADWYLLRLVRPEAAGLVVYCASGNGLTLPALSLETPGVEGRPAEIRAAHSRRDLWFSKSEPLEPTDPLRTFGDPIAGLTHPIFVSGELIGVLTLGRHLQDLPFTAVQANILQTFGDFLGILLRNAAIQEQQVRAMLVTHELDIAAGIQRSLLPTQLPEPPGFRLASHSQSAHEVGGDFFDAIETKNGVLLVIADVMGKGVPAAMFAAILRSQIRARPDLASQPGDFLDWLNTALFRDLDRVEMFVTAQLAFLDPKTRELRIAAAGHCPALVADAQGVREIVTEGLPLGIAVESTYPEKRVPLDPNAWCLLYTDGLIELRNRDDDLLGIDAAKRWLVGAAAEKLTAPDARVSLLRRIREFQGPAYPRDDLTFLLVTPHAEKKTPRRKPSARHAI